MCTCMQKRKQPKHTIIKAHCKYCTDLLAEFAEWKAAYKAEHDVMLV